MLLQQVYVKAAVSDDSILMLFDNTNWIDKGAEVFIFSMNRMNLI